MTLIWCVFVIFNLGNLINNYQAIKNNTTTSVDDNYSKLVIEKLNSLKNAKGVYFKNSNDYNFQNKATSKNPYLSYLGNTALPFIDNLDIIVDLSTFEIENWNKLSHLKEVEQKTVSSYIFPQYVKKLKNLNIFESIDEAQLKFIKENNINFIIASKDTEIPSKILKYCSPQIINKTTGERFYQLQKFNAIN